MKTPSPASILTRLLALAKQRGDDYSLLLNRFALERLLLRLSKSEHADRFLLKGAMLFSLWYDLPHRPTRDADLLGFGSDDAEHLLATFRELAAMDLQDGIVFDAASLRAEAIREDNAYGGTRIHLIGRIGLARCNVQIDVGFGDAVTPEPQAAQFPTLLNDFDSPLLRVYPVYTVIAEKYHAMVILEQANSRMKDFYDLATIARRTDLDGAILAQAIAATFQRRATELPTAKPLALTRQFSEDESKLRQWQGFLMKNRLATESLAQVIVLLERLLWDATEVALGRTAPRYWSAADSAWQ
jgi:predicted nucleotidyltransferase component of viral defense system